LSAIINILFSAGQWSISVLSSNFFRAAGRLRYSNPKSVVNSFELFAP
jgi:hypothetical protein